MYASDSICVMASCNDCFCDVGLNSLLWLPLSDFDHFLNCSLNVCTLPMYLLTMCHSKLALSMFHLCDNDDSNYECQVTVLIACRMEPIDSALEPIQNIQKFKRIIFTIPMQ